MALKDKPKSRSNPAKKRKARVQAEDSDTENARWLPNTNNYDCRSLHRVMLRGNYTVPTYYHVNPNNYDVPETQRATYQLNQSLTGNDAFAKKISNNVVT